MEKVEFWRDSRKSCSFINNNEIKKQIIKIKFFRIRVVIKGWNNFFLQFKNSRKTTEIQWKYWFRGDLACCDLAISSPQKTWQPHKQSNCENSTLASLVGGEKVGIVPPGLQEAI